MLTRPNCDLCNIPLERGVNEKGEEVFFCVNTRCQAQRLSKIDSRLDTIEKHLQEISSLVKETLISEPEDIPSVPPPEIDIIFNAQIRSLPDLSVEDGRTTFYSLLDQLDGSRDELESRLVQIMDSNFLSPQFLRQWAILMAYAGNPFTAGQRVVKEGGQSELPVLEEVISRAASVQPRGRIFDSTQFFSHLHNWARAEGLAKPILDFLCTEAGIPLPIDRKPPEEIIIPPQAPPSPRWVDRFRPEEGWEFAIGANWLRWVGIGAILLSCFALLTWSSAQLELSEEQIAILAFVGAFFAGIFLHFSSFFLLRSRGQGRIASSIAYSLAFLAIGIYFILMFALRFHPSSPFLGDDQLYISLCLLLILTVLLTAWGHSSNVLFLEAFSVALWVIWHTASQLKSDNLIPFSPSNINLAELFGELIWINFLIFILVFLGIAFLRKDMILTSCIQLLSLSVLFLPNSSELLVSNFLTNEINVMIVLLVFLAVIFLIQSFIFPLTRPNQFYDLFTRDHLAITSVTPVFASYFLLSLGNISAALFLPFFLLSTLAFLGLSYYQKDLGVAFLIVLLFQFLWLLSVGLMEDFSIFIPEINLTLIVLIFITFLNWIIARKFPFEVQPRFWDSVNRDHLSIAALGPVLIGFILNGLNFVTNTIFVIFLILFSILWSTNREISVTLPRLFLKDVSMFDFVTFLSSFLFLLTVLIQPGEDLIGLILGFIVFPFLLLISQNFSKLSIEHRAIQEAYAIANSIFMAIIFLILVMNDSFTQLSQQVFSVISISEVQYSHNWAFLGFLWIVIVLLITTRNFRTHIHQNKTKFIMGIISPSVMYLYLSLVDVSEIIILLFVVISYIQFFILSYLFESDSDLESQVKGEKYMFVLPILAVLQIFVFLLQFRGEILWNVLIAVLGNLFLPLSFGVFLVLRKRANHLIDSYLIVSISIITLFHFFFLDSISQGDAWLLQLAFLGFSLLYIYQRMFFEKDQILSPDHSHPALTRVFRQVSFINKDLFGINLVVLSVLVFINTTFCFGIFGAAWFPILVLSMYDLIILFPLGFGLILLGISRRVAIANTLAVYSCGILVRVPFFSSISDSDFISFLVIGLILQLFIHVLLFRLSRSELRSIPSISSWQFEFASRETWKTDSFKIIALINPLLFFYFLSDLIVKGINFFDLTNIRVPLMIAISVFIGIYYVLVTRVEIPRTISDSGLLFSVLIAWFFTFTWPELIEIIYFTAGATAFLCILYGFWGMQKQWRILGLGIIGIIIIYSALYLTQLTETLATILGFGLLGIISIVIGLVYSKFASRFDTSNQTTSE
ncbi:MAG: hypothetical protein ACW98F_04770 [Candidatus Hodarchaeales archaeon]|jgi:hypothetical protein